MINFSIEKTINKGLKKTLLIVFFMIFTTSFSQEFPADFWHQGTIILKKGDTLNGQLKYNLPQNLLFFQQDNRQISFTSNQILSFSFVDTMDSTNRHFSTQDLFFTQEFQITMFFELLNVGENILFTRERIQLSKQAAMAGQGFSNNSYELGYDYYYLPKDSIYLIPIRNTRKGLYQLFGEHKIEMQVFMKKNKMHYFYTSKNDMILIFKKLESLTNKTNEQTINFNYK